MICELCTKRIMEHWGIMLLPFWGSSGMHVRSLTVEVDWASVGKGF